MLQKFLAALVSEEWARAYDATSPSMPIIEAFPLAAELSTMCLSWLQGLPPIAYHEMAFTLHRIHSECAALLRCFATDCKIPISLIPHLGDEIDITGTRPNSFTIETAEQAVGPMYTKLKESLGRTKKRELGVIAEKRQKVVISIEQYSEVKAQHDTRVSAAFSAAFVAFGSTPDKVSPVVKGIMNGIKVCQLLISFVKNLSSFQNEENVDLQTRSAVAVATFIDFCFQHNITQPPDKIVKNLCTFLCQDVEQTPTFAYSRTVFKGILSLNSWSKQTTQSGKNGKDSSKGADIAKAHDEAAKAQLSRRGACLAFNQLSTKFGSQLLHVIPKMWLSMAGGLLSACMTGQKLFFGVFDMPDLYSELPHEADALMDKQYGQDVVDSLSVLEAVVPTFHADLWPKLAELFPAINMALRSRYAIIRQAAARCFATICNVMTSDAMRFVIEKIIPLLGDAIVLSNRQGAAEVVYRMCSSAFSSSIAQTFRRYCPVPRHQSTALRHLPYRPCSRAHERSR